MAPACARLLVVLVFGGACRPAATPSAAPQSQTAVASPSVAGAAIEQDPVATTEVPEPDPGHFTITVSSQCAEAWHASLVRRDEEEPLSGTGRFEATADARTLQLRPGDALVLTNDNGGIMAINFDEVTSDQVAQVEVAEDCSGVHKTVTTVPRP